MEGAVIASVIVLILMKGGSVVGIGWHDEHEKAGVNPIYLLLFLELLLHHYCNHFRVIELVRHLLAPATELCRPVPAFPLSNIDAGCAERVLVTDTCTALPFD